MIASEQQRLLSLVRLTLEAYFKGMSIKNTNDDNYPDWFYVHSGAFVTLTKHHQLRGCVGHIVSEIPLYQLIQKLAIAAAIKDSRFSPVAVTELPDIQIEISVLTPPIQCKTDKDIIVGKHGVILKKNNHQAVFLPQVAIEQDWNRETLLTELSLKAGLLPYAWKKDTDFYTFEATVFHDSRKRN